MRWSGDMGVLEASSCGWMMMCFWVVGLGLVLVESYKKHAKKREGVGCRDKCMEYGDVLLFFRGDR